MAKPPFAMVNGTPYVLASSKYTGISRICLLTSGFKLTISGPETFIRLKDVAAWHEKEFLATGQNRHREWLDVFADALKKFELGKFVFE
jgi:hypothetical protein